MELSQLKKEYEKFVQKYSLPSFKELNENFEIDKLDRESDTLLRAVRKIMIEKVVNSMGFVEMLLNPMNAPRIYLSYIKSMTTADLQRVEKVYQSLAKLSTISLEREIDYMEKGEAELIKEINNIWNSLKEDFREIIKNIKAPPLNSARKDRTYFG